MKKFLSLALLSCVIFSQSIVFATPTTSLNEFAIPIDTIPAGETPSHKKDSGLSSGAVTGIVLGSIFGGLGLLGGLTYYFMHNGAKLGAACVIGENNPMCLMCLKDNVFIAGLKRNCERNKYLIQAINRTPEKRLETSQFLPIQDTKIQNQTFNTVIFKLPEGPENILMDVKLTQISNPFTINGKIPNLDSKILQNSDIKKPIEYPMFVSEIDAKNGILVKQGQIKLSKTNKIGFLVTSYDNSSKKAPSQLYAVLVEYSIH